MPPTCHCWLAWEAALGRVGALGIETLVASRLVRETVTSWHFLLTALHLAEHTFQAFARASARNRLLRRLWLLKVASTSPYAVKNEGILPLVTGLLNSIFIILTRFQAIWIHGHVWGSLVDTILHRPCLAFLAVHSLLPRPVGEGLAPPALLRAPEPSADSLAVRLC